MVAPQPTGFWSVPFEIRNQIIRSVPLTDIPNLILSSRAFHREANQHLYRSVYHLIGSSQPVRYNFPLLRSPTQACYPECSTRISRLQQFLRTITETPTLLSYIEEASFSVVGSGGEGEVDILRQCLGLLGPTTLHLTLSNENAKLALTSLVTSLDIEYPAEKDLGGLQYSLRDHVYSVFSIPSLRHLALRCARSWNAFGPIPDNTRVRTSNVVSLYLPETIPTGPDIQEIITWPKALKYIYHDNDVGERKFFYTIACSRAATIASPGRFLQGIAGQQDSLEEVSYNDEDDRRGHDGSTFSPVLMSEFTNLRTLSVPWSCIVSEYDIGHPLYTCLPPNLEELYLCYYMDVGDSDDEADLTEHLQEVADHKKDCFPFLKSIVVWQWQGGCRGLDYSAMARELLTRLALGPTLKKADIRLDFIFRTPEGPWDANMWR